MAVFRRIQDWDDEVERKWVDGLKGAECPGGRRSELLVVSARVISKMASEPWNNRLIEVNNRAVYSPTTCNAGEDPKASPLYSEGKDQDMKGWSRLFAHGFCNCYAQISIYAFSYVWYLPSPWFAFTQK